MMVRAAWLISLFSLLWKEWYLTAPRTSQYPEAQDSHNNNYVAYRRRDIAVIYFADAWYVRKSQYAEWRSRFTFNRAIAHLCLKCQRYFWPLFLEIREVTNCMISLQFFGRKKLSSRSPSLSTRPKNHRPIFFAINQHICYLISSICTHRIARMSIVYSRNILTTAGNVSRILTDICWCEFRCVPAPSPSPSRRIPPTFWNRCHTDIMHIYAARRPWLFVFLVVAFIQLFAFWQY